MPQTISVRAGDRYTVREKVFKLLGNEFRIYDQRGELIGFCKQKAFRLREDLTIYTDPTAKQQLLRMQARSIIDFSVTYDVRLPDSAPLGSIRRRGMRSLVRDSWGIYDVQDNKISTVSEHGSALARRLVPLYVLFSPPVLHIDATDGTRIAELSAYSNPFVPKVGVRVLRDDEHVDDLIVLAVTCLYMAIRAQQRNNNSGGGG